MKKLQEINRNIKTIKQRIYLCRSIQKIILMIIIVKLIKLNKNLKEKSKYMYTVLLTEISRRFLESL